VTIPDTAINLAAFIWIDDTSYNSSDEFLIAGAQLETGTEISPFRNAMLVASTYAATNVSISRAFDADTALTADIADVLGTLIADLRIAGIVG
jgi:hypothetical protein